MGVTRPRRPSNPAVIGADLIHEARQVEREWTLMSVRKEIEAIPVSERDTRDRWKHNDRLAAQFRTDVLSVLNRLEEAR